jgi:hypothetical protein
VRNCKPAVSGRTWGARGRIAPFAPSVNYCSDLSLAFGVVRTATGIAMAAVMVVGFVLPAAVTVSTSCRI